MSTRKKRSSPRIPTRQTVVALIKLERRGVFRGEEAEQVGFSQPTLSRLVARGALRRVGRGFYLHRAAKISPEHLPFIVGCKKFGYPAVIGGPSALYYHGLLARPPAAVWVFVRYKQKTVSDSYRCLRTMGNFSNRVLDRSHFRVTDMDRTLVDCLKYGPKIGRSLVVRALRKALKTNQTTETKLLRAAVSLGFERVVKKRLAIWLR